MKPCTKEIRFQCENRLLSGTLHLPERPYPNLVVGSHGLEGSKDSAKQLRLSGILPENGIAFFRFDHRGCGQSQGKFGEETSVEMRAADLAAAVQYLSALDIDFRQTALFGSSLGGATCLKAWKSIEKAGIHLSGAVICAAPIQSRTISVVPTLAYEHLPPLPINFFKKNLDFDLTEDAVYANHILILHGDRDDVVPVENARTIYEAAGEPKKLFILENADHRFSDEEHQKIFEKMTLEWFQQCLDTD